MHLAQHLYLNVSSSMLGKMGMKYNMNKNQTSIIELLDNIEITENNSNGKDDFVKVLNKLVEIKLNELGKTYFEILKENKNRENQLKKLNAWAIWLEENEEILQ
ncbi:MAG: hypothetical protein CMO19_03885 [Thaumarchaeota archaeon]|nr:hypothetical protein [Nitrososphaerota archaeon]